jgi:hypothetical protein
MRCRSLALAGLLAGLAACAAERPRRVYVLSSPATLVGGSATAGPILQLRRVLVPDYLDTREIRLRVGAHELRSSATGEWGERLSIGVTRALLVDLSARLPMDRVIPANSGERSATQVLATIEDFDVWPNGRCVLVATWTLVPQTGETTPRTTRATISLPAAAQERASDETIVDRMALALDKLADRIAASAKGLPVP